MRSILKRALSVLLTAVLMTALATTALAITIESTENNTTYTLYKVLEVEANTDASAVLYTWADNVSDTVKTAAASSVITAQGNYISVSDAASFAKAVLENANGLTPISARANTAFTLDDGYYVMSSSAHTTPFAFSVINGAIKTSLTGWTTDTIQEKASLPQIAKSVVESTASIGDTVTYTITVTAEKAGKNYAVVDTLPDGITYNNDLEIANLTVDNQYTVEANGQTITVKFKQAHLDTLDDSTSIVITYTGTVNENINIWDGVESTTADNNTNTATLYYGDSTNSNGLGALNKSASADVHSYQIDLSKTDGQNPLSGATFELWKDGNKITMAGDATNGYYPVAGGSAVITAGTVTIYGLGNGTYTLKETKAPAGYTAADTSVTIDGDNATVTVVNKPGTLLPETGGIGTTVFYAAGAALMLGAGAVLLRRKRRSAES